MPIPSSLERSLPFTLERADGDEGSDGLTLDGYAAVFDVPTRIDSWEGCFDETIQRGAFRKSIRENTPVLQFDHGRHPMIGSIPLGRITQLEEDDQGLHVVARFTDNWLIQPIRDAIRDEAIDGMSFRFEVVREEWRDASGKVIRDPNEIRRLIWQPDESGPLTRVLKEVRCAELGPVVFPAYKETSVSARSKDETRSAQREIVRDLMLAESAPVDSDHPDENRDATPTDSGHLAESEDAPVDSDHPSPVTDPHSERRRANVREILALMRAKNAALNEEK